MQEATLVEFTLPTATAVELRVLNPLGQVVATLRQGPAAAGRHRLQWARAGLAAGLYYVQLRGPGFARVTKAQLQ